MGQLRKGRLGGREYSLEEESFSAPQSDLRLQFTTISQYRLNISRSTSVHKFVSLDPDLISSSDN